MLNLQQNRKNALDKILKKVSNCIKFLLLTFIIYKKLLVSFLSNWFGKYWNNYSPPWTALDIYLDASSPGIKSPLFTSPSGDSCIVYCNGNKFLFFRRGGGGGGGSWAFWRGSFPTSNTLDRTLFIFMLVKKLTPTLTLTLILTQSLTSPTPLDLPQKLQHALAFLRKNEIATNRPFYWYGGYIELIRFEEYYSMPRGHEHISFVFSNVFRDTFS